MVLLFITKSIVILTNKNLQMKYSIPLLTLMLVFIGCKNDKPVALSIKKVEKIIKDDCKEEECAEVSLNYIIVSGNEEVTKKINTVIEDFIKTSLNISDDSLYVAKSIEEATANFIKIYKRDKADYPDMGVYFSKISVIDLFSSPSVLSLEMNAYQYTGGAHGYGATSYVNIDPQTGEELRFDDLLKDKEGFITLAETLFRKENDIPKNEAINSTGLWFENDTFYLPDTFGITPDELIFVYNQYEIASYAAGPIELLVPIEEARPFLSIAIND